MIIDDARIYYVRVGEEFPTPRRILLVRKLLCRETDRRPAMTLTPGTTGKLDSMCVRVCSELILTLCENRGFVGEDAEP